VCGVCVVCSVCVVCCVYVCVIWFLCWKNSVCDLIGTSLRPSE